MKISWFVRKRILYWPVSILGWIIFISAFGVAVYLFIDIDSHSHSASDTLINWVFNSLIAGVIYSAIGFLTEKKDEA